MQNAPLTKRYFLEPGYVCVPREPMHLAAVVASGIVVTVYDRRMRRGGMGIYTHPRRCAEQSTAVFAAPSITSLVMLFVDSGSSKSDLEAHLCGGAVNSSSPFFVRGQSEANVQVGEEILLKLGVDVAGRDVGGRMPRKVVFHSATGEIVIAKVHGVRRTDWYPPYDPQQRKQRELGR